MFGFFKRKIIIMEDQLDKDINIQFYNSFSYIFHTGLEPYATIFHFDTPQALFDEYGGFLSEDIV